MSTTHRLGSWTCPSGNSVDVDLVPVSGLMSTLEFRWDQAPPLRPVDEVYYRAVILPDVTRRVAEYKELVGNVLVVQP
jgi:hypothetical protein